MIKVFENAKVGYYFEDIENEKLVRMTLADLDQDADQGEIENVGHAIEGLSDLPLVHAIVTKSERLIV